jgi:hypothetical protein
MSSGAAERPRGDDGIACLPHPQSHLRRTGDERCVRTGYARGSDAGGAPAFAGVFIEFFVTA